MGEDSGGDSSSDEENVGEDEDEAMEDAGPSEPPAAVNRAPVVDDDGFTLVQKGSRRR